MEDELQRYVEYLQRALLSDGSAQIHDPQLFRGWVEKNRQQLIHISEDSGGGAFVVDELERQLAAFSPSSSFDSFSAQAIFNPLLESVLRAAQTVHCAPQREIIFANSTDIAPSPAVRPSPDKHLLFVGAGTFAFCNYWAKAVAEIVEVFRKQMGGVGMTQDLLLCCCAINPAPFLNACRLTLYCRHHESSVGYGIVPIAAEAAAYRNVLLQAMETFVIAHEVAHCFIEECRASQLLSAPEEEYLCDEYALLISRVIANAAEEWSMFSGAGGYLFLRLAAVCFPETGARSGVPSASHPTSQDRSIRLVELVSKHTDVEQRDSVLAYLNDLDACCSTLEYLLKSLNVNRI